MMGANPCYIINDENVIVANYSGGNIAVFGKNNDGSIGDKQVVQHYGKGSNAKRQEGTRSYGSFFSRQKVCAV
jgi:6-phosphogluconolactonase